MLIMTRAVLLKSLFLTKKSSLSIFVNKESKDRITSLKLLIKSKKPLSSSLNEKKKSFYLTKNHPIQSSVKSFSKRQAQSNQNLVEKLSGEKLRPEFIISHKSKRNKLAHALTERSKSSFKVILPSGLDLLRGYIEKGQRSEEKTFIGRLKADQRKLNTSGSQPPREKGGTPRKKQAPLKIMSLRAIKVVPRNSKLIKNFNSVISKCGFQ